MILIARPLLSSPQAPDILRLWVGVFGVANPAPPAFASGSKPDALKTLGPGPFGQWFAIRDGVTNGSGQALNHQGIFKLPRIGPGESHVIRITTGALSKDFTFISQPDQVPLSAPLNLLLGSCYYQPNDDGGLLTSRVRRLPTQYRPHLSLLAGDQVYLDVPVVGSWRLTLDAIRQMIGDKYFTNWCSDHLHVSGLQTLLQTAPTACIPDDHEFWNNYPLFQAQVIPQLWINNGQWSATAMALYEDYQLGDQHPQILDMDSFQRIEIDPLSILMLDTRSRRDDKFDQLMPPAAEAELARWGEDLIKAKQNNTPKVGVLSAGQPLFTDPPGVIGRRFIDGDLANYRQFEKIEAQLVNLASHGIPVVFLTGDVHWSRVCVARYGTFPTPMLFEVICSPSTLIPRDSLRDIAWDTLRGEAWPGYPDPLEPLPKFGRNNSFKISKSEDDGYFSCKGNQISVLQFKRAGGGLDMTVNFFDVSDEPRLQKTKSTQPYKLRFY
ncbi:hypothetical protein ACKJSM_21250 [Pseudomonas sp. PHC1]|uniref:hypothetical protein n=1 Tax=Pseudomonas sp. PHC1 TaxID=3384759 RepID=UPI00396F4200